MAARPSRTTPAMPTMTALLTAVLLAAGLSGAAAPVHASAYHTEPLDGLMARCSTIATTRLPEQSLAQYDVEADADRGLFSCVVQPRDGATLPDNVRARVQASYWPIGQAPETIDIREVREGDLVTYLGTYRIGGSEPLEFDVRIEVEGRAERRVRFTDHNPRGAVTQSQGGGSPQSR